MRNSLTLYGNWNDRVAVDQSCWDPVAFTTIQCRSTFNSRRFGLEYQADLRLGAMGSLIFGGKTEREEADSRQAGLGLASSFLVQQLAGVQTTNSVFAIHQFSLGSQLDISLGGRIDAVEGVEVFPTWRATAAYRIDETNTKLRASAGTGAKAPSLYQRFSEYGNLGLKPEENIGYDVGIDQRFLDGRVVLSATWFDAKYTNLIDIDWASFPYRYYNISQARIKGLETNADIILAPGEWKARVSYTYMSAINEVTGDPLPRRPRNKGGLALTYMGIPKLEVEGRSFSLASGLTQRLPLAFTIPGIFALTLEAITGSTKMSKRICGSKTSRTNAMKRF